MHIKWLHRDHTPPPAPDATMPPQPSSTLDSFFPTSSTSLPGPMHPSAHSPSNSTAYPSMWTYPDGHALTTSPPAVSPPGSSVSLGASPPAGGKSLDSTSTPFAIFLAGASVSALVPSMLSSSTLSLSPFGSPSTESETHSGVSRTPAVQAEIRQRRAIYEAERLFSTSQRPNTDLISDVLDTIDSADETLGTLADVLSGIDALNNVVSTIEDMPYLKMAAAVLRAVTKPILLQAERDEAVRQLLEELKQEDRVATFSDLFVEMKATCNLAFNPYAQQVSDAEKLLFEQEKQILEKLSQQYVHCAFFIQDQYSTKSFWLRAGKNILRGHALSDKADAYKAKFAELRSKLDEIRKEARHTRQAAVYINLCNGIDQLAHTVDTVKELELRAQMRYCNDSGYSSHKLCLSGTRVDTIEKVCNWINSPREDTRVLFLVGVAGSGKSFIAHTVGRRFRELDRLGSFFAFDVLKPHALVDVVSTVARNLADWNTAYARGLYQILEKRRTLFDTQDVANAWRDLIVDISAQVTFDGPVLLVFDALDEFSKEPNGRADLVALLTEFVTALPGNFRIIVTSRPEHDISACHSKPTVSWLDLADAKAEATSDIRSYVRRTLREGDDEASDEQCDTLAVAADGLFVWAATACRFVLDQSAALTVGERFDEHFPSIHDTDAGPSRDLRSLYVAVLKAKIGVTLTAAMKFRPVMARVLCAAEPVSIDAMTSLCHSGSSVDFARILRVLGAVLDGVSDSSTPVRPMHKSFRDFLRDPIRAQSWHISDQDLSDAQLLMCAGTFRVMKEHLRFNMCGLETSYKSNAEVSDLPARVAQLDPALVYSSCYWGLHLTRTSAGSPPPDAVELVRHLLREKFIFWLELLSVASRVGHGMPNLRALLHLESFKADAFVEDASLFIRHTFTIISRSAPHVYLSALPLVPSTSLIRRHYLPRFTSLPTTQGSTIGSWPVLEQTLYVSADWVLCTASSPDQEFIAVGQKDMTVRVSRVQDIELDVHYFRGIEAPVWSVAYSKDGIIVAGGENGCLCCWDAVTHAPLGSLISAHEGRVTALVFTPDGRHFISSGVDGSILLWNAPVELAKYIRKPDSDIGIPATYAPVHEPLRTTSEGDESDPVLCLGWTPDGRLLSGSIYGSLEIWNVETKACQRITIVRSSSSESVPSSPSSSSGSLPSSPSPCDVPLPLSPSSSSDSLASSPSSNSDSETSFVLPSTVPLPILSLSGSPTANHVALGFAPETLGLPFAPTIGIWDVDTCEQIGTSLHGHSTDVTSLSWSSDGKQLVSTSNDMSVRFWDVETCTAVGEPLWGHTGGVTGAVISLDGSRIVSGACDCTLRVWTVAQIKNSIASSYGGVETVLYSCDGRFIRATSYGREWPQYFDVQTRREIEEPVDVDWLVPSNIYEDDQTGGSLKATISSNETVHIVDNETGQVHGEPLSDRGNKFTYVVFSHDGQRLLTLSWDAVVRVWDFGTRDLLYSGQSYPKQSPAPNFGAYALAMSAALSPDGRFVAIGGYDSRVRVVALTNTLDDADGGTTAQQQSILNFQVPGSGQNPRELIYNSETGAIHDTATGFSVLYPIGRRGSWGTSIYVKGMGELPLGLDAATIDFSNTYHGADWAKIYPTDIGTATASA
ncbi:hypothetical protein EXIGLDRAFT_745601 [Exidia glandulosa HHB12029]|uniref:NACHT domain-containing protein n=1 Tax=Exidia glandulosa HHB12029 TaxID=1314781 RepID=A0A165NDC1_EXIGL|nr:hypothetical protein EXIGLDRAFT_745601 [Exidia glandulosa HHB12029]